MRATRDYIPEALEGQFPAQTDRIGFRDWVKPTASEKLRAEREAIKNAVDQGLRPAEDLVAWDAAHPEAETPRKKVRKRRFADLPPVPEPEESVPELAVDAAAEAVPDPWAFEGEDEEEGDAED